MKAWIYDDLPGDKREPHNQGDSASVNLSHLESLGVSVKSGINENGMEKIAKESGFKYRDASILSHEALPGKLFDKVLEDAYKEHMHEGEEIRYVYAGEAYWDVRDRPESRWVRIAASQGDLIELPIGIYHRFTLKKGVDFADALALWKRPNKDSQLKTFYRDVGTDSGKVHKDYLQSISSAKR
ncbi:hypothetical protein P7C70_g8030, partial [Phenoliferia sp. Uapishka_3]